jgi:hypothetical protein
MRRIRAEDVNTAARAVRLAREVAVSTAKKIRRSLIVCMGESCETSTR